MFELETTFGDLVFAVTRNQQGDDETDALHAAREALRSYVSAKDAELNRLAGMIGRYQELANEMLNVANRPDCGTRHVR